MTRACNAVFMAGCAICGLTTGVAHAQTASASPPEASNGEALQDIIVTAQHRAENLQKTPVAVTALSGRELSEQGIQTSENLNGTIPNFRVGEGSREIQFTIRGITASNVGPQQDAPVAVYLDGVYLSRPSFIGSAFYDMERVEVLRGPQGTLFGRNADGGAVNYITAKPVSTYEGALELSKGDYSSTVAKGMVNIPINDQIDVRIAAMYAYHRGYEASNFIVGSIASQDLNAERIHIRYRPTDKLEFLLSANNYTSSGTPSEQDIVKTPTYTPNGRQGTFNTPFKSDQHGYGVTLQASYDFNFAKLVSISSYRYDYVEDIYDRDFSRGFSVGDRWNPAKSKSQELRLISPDDKRLSYIAGLYYFQSDDQDSNNVFTNNDRTLGTATRGPEVGDLSYAGYAQATFKIMPDLRLTGGVRETYERKKIDGRYTSNDVVNFTNLALVAGSFDRANWSTPTWKAGLDWSVTPNNLLYGSVSTGWKAGGLNSVTDPTLQKYEPETITAYEIGSKNEFFDKHLRLNLDAFYYDYKSVQLNSQVDTATTVVRLTTNGGSARVYGAELETAFVVSDAFQVEANLAYLAVAKYTSLSAMLDVLNNNNNANLTGRRMPNTPKITLNVSPTYTINMPDGHLKLRADFQYTSSQVFTPFGTQPYVTTSPTGVQTLISNNIYANAFQGNYTRTNLSVRYESDKKWYVELYVHNLENKEQLEYTVFTSVAGSGGYTPPRTFGVTVGARL